jgi:peptide/nickel transport system permease protein
VSCRIYQQQIAQLKAEFGLDKPGCQYFNWIGESSMVTWVSPYPPSTGGGRNHPPFTHHIHIGLTAYIIGLIIGIPAGIICAIRRGKFIDTLVTTLSNLGITVPSFWLGVMMIYFFGLYLRWLPVEGYTSPFDNFWLSTRQLVMPVICMVLFPIASLTRQTRSSMLEVMRQDYIRTAWSKGLRERVIIMRHALKNGLIPVITLSGMGLSMIIGGAVIIEQVFNIPGMGRLAVTSILNQDYPYVQGIVLIIATFVMLVNLLVDLTYGWLDPRIRYS